MGKSTHYITYVDEKKLIKLLSNDMKSIPTETINMYRKQGNIELLFKQIKQKSLKTEFIPLSENKS